MLVTFMVALRPAAGGAAAGPAGPDAAAAAAPAQPAAAYWLAGADGSVFAFGAPVLGSMTGVRLVRPVVGMTATSTGRGYRMVAADGAVFAFGDASFSGSTGGVTLHRPVVGMAASPSGAGYWLVAADGGVFAFGDASFYGSTGGLPLHRPVVGMAASPSGAGYWLVAADGGVFAFGDASFSGSTGGVPLHRPVVGMAASPSGAGYWLVAADGGLFSFGGAAFHGSAGGSALRRPIVGMAASPSGAGYLLAAADGGVFTFGDARFAGSMGGQRLASAIVGAAVDVAPRPFVPGQRGYDISWPQCGRRYPSRPFDIAIVGVNGGRGLTTNPCFGDQATRWASPGQLDVYLNLNRPSVGFTGGCGPTERACIAQAFGREAVRTSLGTVRTAGVAPRLWWLDIEGPSTWDPDTRLNALTIQAAVDALQAAGITVGIYSTRYQWGVITGGYSTSLPLMLWVPGVSPLQRCNEPFAGGYVVLSQVIGEASPSGFDENYAC